VWDVKTGALKHLLNAHMVMDLCFSPDGKTLATAGVDHKVNLWDVAGAKVRRTLQGHTRPVRAVAFSADGRLLVSGSEDGTIRLWRLPPQAPKKGTGR
jgi:WD40 repeat protein